MSVDELRATGSEVARASAELSPARDTAHHRRRTVWILDIERTGYATAASSHRDQPVAASLQGVIELAQERDVVLLPKLPIAELIHYCETLLTRNLVVAIDGAAASALPRSLTQRMYGGDRIILRPPSANVLPSAVSRAADFAFSAIALIILAPLLALMAVAVRASSPGPALFAAERVGRNGKIFRLYKFRSMTRRDNGDDAVSRQESYREFMNVQNANGQNLKVVDRSRVTVVGKFLRKHSLDELPQFWNVLKGDLSLVGARPCTPYEFALYLPWHSMRFSGRPGLTGLWQAYGRSKVTFEEMVLMDYCYGKAKSLWVDLRILIRTAVVVLTGDGGQ